MSGRNARIASTLGLAFALATGGMLVRSVSARDSTVLPTVPPGFEIETIAHVDRPRELAVTPSGDLLIGTSDNGVEIVPDAVGTPREAHLFARLEDRGAAGIALGRDALYVGTYGGVWRIPYERGDETARAKATRIATVRPGGGGGHTTTSVAVGRDTLYAGVGSSCNACDEHDPTRASVVAMGLAGENPHPRATHIRNAIALAVDPQTGALWAGVAGQDELEPGHPYEIFDPIGAHAGTPDYGWPTCYEDHRAVDGRRDCSAQTPARVIFPAYETPIGAAFYPTAGSGSHAFPRAYRGGAFVTLHGSWHQPPVEPRVVFVPLHGDEPVTAVNWHDPRVQWSNFLGGFQRADGSRMGRPTGVAVAPDGSLFVADDYADAIYRIRPRS